MEALHTPGRIWPSMSLRPSRIHRAPKVRTAAWAGALVLASCALLAVVLIAGKAMIGDVVSQELASGASLQHSFIPPAVRAEDDFYQQKLNAKAEELPAQF